jgi:MFS family permease
LRLRRHAEASLRLDHRSGDVRRAVDDGRHPRDARRPDGAARDGVRLEPDGDLGGVAVNIALFGLIGPFAASVMDRWGLRRVVMTRWFDERRGLVLGALSAANATGQLVFAVFYGLDWIATVPPTVRLTTGAFGRENTGVIYGWIGASHQLGASFAALGAGAIRSALGDYSLAFWISGGLCVAAGLSFLTIGRGAFRAAPILKAPAVSG